MTLPLILGPPLSPDYWKKVGAIRRANLIAHYTMSEQSGVASIDRSTQGNDGVLTNVTLGAPGIGDGLSSGFFDGADSRNNIYSAGLVADFDGEKGSWLIWVKPNAGAVWTDTNLRRLLWLRADDDNRTYLQSVGDGTINCVYEAANTGLNIVLTSWTVFTPILLTWNKVADEVRAYKLGTQVGATVNGLGAWVGDLAATTTVIGAGSSAGAQPWHGWIGHVLIWNDTLTPDEVKIASTP